MDTKVERKRKEDESKDCGERGISIQTFITRRARNLYRTFFWCTLNASWLEERCAVFLGAALLPHAKLPLKRQLDFEDI